MSRPAPVLAGLMMLLPFAGCGGGGAVDTPMPSEYLPSRPDRMVLTDAQWRQRLTSEQYMILRRGATERPFCEVYAAAKHHGPGTYCCAGCGLELFVSDAKFDSESGWPSFLQPAGGDRIDERRDTSHGMDRVEILCARCGGHLGHVFEDGPAPTGLRYCVNGGALIYKPSEP